MESVGGRRAADKAAAIGASLSRRGGHSPRTRAPKRSGSRPPLPPIARSRARRMAVRTTDEQDAVVRSVLSKNHRIATWREP